jgi:predicted ArsR family transcriptional regulator
MSGEAVRQQLLALQREGWVEALHERPQTSRSGRPAARYRLTAAGDHLFPKQYDMLTVAVLDAVSAEMGPEALARVLGALTEARVAQWEQKLAGKTLRERVQALRAIYQGDDPYMEAEEAPGGFRLIEHNCPFLNVALQRPAVCSVTVSLLSRLLGVQVVREERFQAGQGRCCFHVLADQPITSDEPVFHPEPEENWHPVTADTSNGGAQR